MLYILVILVTFISLIESQHLNDSKRLYSDILSGYNKDIIPVVNDSEPLDLLVHSFLFHIKSFEEVQESITVSISLRLDWTDDSLSWDPNNYGGKQQIYISSDKIWTPSMILGTTAGEMDTIGRNQGINVLVSYNGVVSFRPGGTLEAICPTDVSNFPFDTQTCMLKFVPRGYSASAIKLKTSLDYVSGSFFHTHPDWTISSNKTIIFKENKDFNVESYRVRLTITRHPTYYALIIIVPTMLFCLLNPLVFLLPIESGERISLAMTILLSYVVFLTLVSDSMPAKSNPMCYLLVTMTAVIVVSGLMVGLSIISVMFYFRDTQESSGCDQEVSGKSRKSCKNLSGKQISKTLDKSFCLISYLFFCAIIITYFILVR